MSDTKRRCQLIACYTQSMDAAIRHGDDDVARSYQEALEEVEGLTPPQYTWVPLYRGGGIQAVAREGGY